MGRCHRARREAGRSRGRRSRGALRPRYRLRPKQPQNLYVARTYVSRPLTLLIDLLTAEEAAVDLRTRQLASTSACSPRG